MKFSWRYLAGFTDADGYITAQMQGDFIVAARNGWSQTSSAEWLLLEIQEWLAEKGVASSFNRECDRWGTKSCRLRVQKKESAKIVLNRMLPYLVLKQDRAREVLDLISEKEEAQREHGYQFRSKV
jgi:hypothetical protein